MRFHFESESKLVRQLPSVEKLPEEFWGSNITNLNMVVGNNGAGKTSLMQFIIGMMTDVAYNTRTESLGRGILIFLDKEELLLYDFVCGVETLVRCETSKLHWKHIRNFELKERFSKFKVMFLTNALTYADYQRGLKHHSGGKNDFLYDCSVGNLITADIKQDQNIKARGQQVSDDLQAYFYYEKYKQVKFVYDRNQYAILEKMRKMGYPVPTPERLYINLLLENRVHGHAEIESEIKFANMIREFNLFKIEYEDICKKSIEWTNNKETPNNHIFPYQLLSYLLCTGCIYCAIDSAMHYLNAENAGRFKTIMLNDVEFLRNKNKRTLNYFEIIECIWTSYTKSIGDSSRDVRMIVNNYIEFIRTADNVENVAKYFRIETPRDEIMYPDIAGYRISVSTKESSWFIEFMQKYRYICMPNYFLIFDWGLSSGENNLISLFSSFYYIFDYDFASGNYGEPYFENKRGQNMPKERCDSLLILIDEADLSYHLEWQKQFISILTMFLQLEYSNECCSNIQIILTTHSPLMLSDIPEQNVIYLRYDTSTRRVHVDVGHKIGTFGQNVHILMRDSFFLESGTMGKFADNKICQMIKRLADLKHEIDCIEKLEDQNNKSEALKSLEIEKQKQLDDDATLAKLIAEPIISRKLLENIHDLTQKLRPRVRTRLEQELELELEHYSKDDLLNLKELIGRHLNEL
jgi:hypothetical protein